MSKSNKQELLKCNQYVIARIDDGYIGEVITDNNGEAFSSPDVALKHLTENENTDVIQRWTWVVCKLQPVGVVNMTPHLESI